MKTLKLLLAIVLISSCATNPNTFHTKNERVEINLIEKGKGLLSAGILSVLVPSVVSWTTSKIKRVTEKRSKEFVATYSKTYSGDDFYTLSNEKKKVAKETSAKKIFKHTSTDKDTIITYERETIIKEMVEQNKQKLNLKYEDLEIYRYIGEEEASYIKLSFFTNSDNSLLAIRPTVVEIKKTKARLKKSDNNLDLTVGIKIHGYHKDKAGKNLKELLGDVNFTLKDITIDKKYVEHDGFFTHDKSPTVNKDIRTDWFFPVPISHELKEKTSGAYGNFSITVNVQESDEYSKRIKEIGEEIDTASSIISSDLLKQIFGVE